MGGENGLRKKRRKESFCVGNGDKPTREKFLNCPDKQTPIKGFCSWGMGGSGYFFGG